MRVIPYNPGPGGNNPRQVVLDESGAQPCLLGSYDFLPAGYSGACVWLMLTNEGQVPCCPGHRGPGGWATQAMDLGRSLAAVSKKWRFDKPAPVHGRVHDFLSPVLIPASKVAGRTDLPFVSAAELALNLANLKNRLALRTVPTHMHIAVLVDRLPVVLRAVPPAAGFWPEAAPTPAPTAAASPAWLLEVDEASSIAELQRNVDVLQQSMAALQLQLQQVTTELAAAKAADAAAAEDRVPGSTWRATDSASKGDGNEGGVTDTEVEGFAVMD